MPGGVDGGDDFELRVLMRKGKYSLAHPAAGAVDRDACLHGFPCHA
jgi:hypothetical protein